MRFLSPHMPVSFSSIDSILRKRHTNHEQLSALLRNLPTSTNLTVQAAM
jgi:hypothetical protein